MKVGGMMRLMFKFFDDRNLRSNGRSLAQTYSCLTSTTFPPHFHLVPTCYQKAFSHHTPLPLMVSKKKRKGISNHVRMTVIDNSTGLVASTSGLQDIRLARLAQEQEMAEQRASKFHQLYFECILLQFYQDYNQVLGNYYLKLHSRSEAIPTNSVLTNTLWRTRARIQVGRMLMMLKTR